MQAGGGGGSAGRKSSSRLDMHKSVEVQVDSDFALLLPGGVYEIKKMEPRPKIRTIIVFCVVLAISGIIGFGYFCPDQVKMGSLSGAAHRASRINVVSFRDRYVP